MRVFLSCLVPACLLYQHVSRGSCPYPYGFPTSLHIFYPSSKLFGGSSIP